MATAPSGQGIDNQALSDRTGVSISTIKRWVKAAQLGQIISPKGKNAEVYSKWEWRDGLWFEH